jgi:hypothetical protein
MFEAFSISARAERSAAEIAASPDVGAAFAAAAKSEAIRPINIVGLYY